MNDDDDETQLEFAGLRPSQRRRPLTVWPKWFRVAKNTPAGWLHNVGAGRHPFGAGLGPADRTCRECRHVLEDEDRPFRGNREYKKCAKARRTRGAATDLRVSWRACEFFEERAARGPAEVLDLDNYKPRGQS